MKERLITIPELAMIAGTRGMLGAGIGLLLAGRMNDDRRRGAGTALIIVGLLTTIPLAMEVLGRPAVRSLPIE